MTVPLSPHKVSKILRGYFLGLLQMKIAKEAGVDQSSISHYASRFKETAAEVGILVAGKEYQVMNEVESLRSLSVELYKTKLSAEEARQGHNIIKAFLKLGISSAQHLALIKVCQEVNDSGFARAALKLSQIEMHTGTSYNEVMLEFQQAQEQLPQLEEKIVKAKAGLKYINDALVNKKQELAGQAEHLKKYQNEVKAKEAQFEKELSSKMKKLEVEKKEVEEAAALKTELTKKGLDLQTVLKLAKEF
jgi:predicted transcriptional regulator